MPSPIVKDYAKKSGKSVSEVEQLWSRAKSITADTFGMSEDEFGDKQYRYATGTLKNMLGLEEKYSIADFVNSELSAKQFIEKMMEELGVMGGPVKSGDFSISNVIPPESTGTEDEEEDIDSAIERFSKEDKREDTSEEMELPTTGGDVIDPKKNDSDIAERQESVEDMDDDKYVSQLDELFEGEEKEID